MIGHFGASENRKFGHFRKFGDFGKSASDRGSAGAAAKNYVRIGGRPARPKIFAEKPPLLSSMSSKITDLF